MRSFMAWIILYMLICKKEITAMPGNNWIIYRVLKKYILKILKLLMPMLPYLPAIFLRIKCGKKLLLWNCILLISHGRSFPGKRRSFILPGYWVLSILAITIWQGLN